MENFRRTLISKRALILIAKGEVEIAAQFFNYDDIREIRADFKKLEVRILMNYDESYYRVFTIKPKDDSEKEIEEAKKKIAKFHSDLVNASMKFTKEDIEIMKKIQDRQQELAKKVS